MKLLALAAVFAATTSTLAFCPSSPLRQPLTGQTRSLSLQSSLTALPSLPNPYKNLPWVTERERIRQERSITHDNAALFRELGLPEDATYEEVKAKTDHLIDLAEGDVKKKIRVEVARDKIYAMRLKERVTGVKKPEGEVLRMSKFEDGTLQELSDDVSDIIKPKKDRVPITLRLPLVPYFLSIIKPPDAAWQKRQITIWSLSTLLCLFLPSLTESALRINWLPAGGMMGYRGMNIESGDGGYNPYRGRRNKIHQVKAMGIAIMIWVAARGVAESVVSRVPAMAMSRSAEFFKFCIVQAALGFSTMWIQTYKDGEDTKDLMI